MNQIKEEQMTFMPLKKKIALITLSGLFLIAVIVLILVRVKIRGGITGLTAGASCKYLVSYDRDGGASPTYLATNLGRIESMIDFPYNGVTVLESYSSSSTMTSTPTSVTKFNDGLKPLREMAQKPEKVKHNFVRVLLKDPGDMFDDAGWNVASQNFQNLGVALKTLYDSGFGVDGVLFDNEGPYSRPTCSTGEDTHGLWNIPVTSSELTEFRDHPDCWPYIRNLGTHSASDYKEKALVRGKQVMEGLRTGWSDVKLIFMHSSDVSCTGTDDLGIRVNDVAYANEMLGPFAVGLAEGAYGTSAKVIDGGEESYGYVNDANFNLSFNFRNSDTSDSYTPDMTTHSGCAFIPASDKPIWTGLYEIAFALYNKVHGVGGGQTSSTIGAATEQALIHSDNYVWFYTEDKNSIDPSASNYISSSWMTPIINGRKAVVNDPICETGGQETIPSAPSNLAATAASSTQINLAWTDNSDNETGFRVERSTSADSGFVQVDSVGSNVTTYSSLSLAESTTYYFRVKAYNTAGDSAYSNVASATTQPGSTRPAAPSNLVATAVSSSQINLTWTDNSNNENGFSIERSPSATTGFTQVDWVASNDVTYEDTGLLSSTLYYYRVKSFNSAPDSPSASSNTASATTLSNIPPTLSVSYSPQSPTSRTYVKISANVSNDTQNAIKTIRIFVNNSLVKMCTGSPVTSCSYTKKYPAGTYQYYATSEGVSLRSPITGYYTFIVKKWWKFW